MSGVLLIARREFVERGRSRVFLGVLFASMLLILVGMFAVSLVGRPAPAATVGLGGTYSAALPAQVAAAAQAQGLDLTLVGDLSPERARAAVEARTVDAALVDGSTILALGGPPPAVESVLRSAATEVARAEVAGDLGLEPAQVDEVLRPVDVEVVDVAQQGPSDALAPARGAAAFASVVVLFVLVMAFGQFVGSAVVEEKQTRVAELVLAKVPTAGMIVGKVLGIGGLGLVQLGILGLTYLAGLRAFGGDSAGLALFRLDAGSLFWLSTWFVLGYALYSFVFATMGATVSRLEDLQSLTYVPSVVMLPAYGVAALSLAGGPSPLLAPMSMVPFWSPLLMPFRQLGAGAPAWQVLIALAGTVGTIVLLVWVGARVYRGAALRTGGRVPLREAWREG